MRAALSRSHPGHCGLVVGGAGEESGLDPFRSSASGRPVSFLTSLDATNTDVIFLLMHSSAS